MSLKFSGGYTIMTHWLNLAFFQIYKVQKFAYRIIRVRGVHINDVIKKSCMCVFNILLIKTVWVNTLWVRGIFSPLRWSTCHLKFFNRLLSQKEKQLTAVKNWANSQKNPNGPEWKKSSFWVKIIVILWDALLLTNSIFFSAWDM